MRPFRCSAPLDGCSPLLLASPHSGTHVPRAALARTCAPPSALRRLEDAHVGRLLSAASAHAPLIEATHARAVIDLNRAETDIDPETVEGMAADRPLPERTRAGFGLFPKLAGPGQPVLARPLPRAEAVARIATLHRPWHAALAGGLAAARARHGIALLLDMHSMPPVSPGGPHVVLGDRHGTSAAPALVDALEAAFRARGLATARNHPYAGGHTLERHARPAEGLHAIQVELCRSLYMNPETLEPHAGFAPLAALLADVVAELVATLSPLSPALPLAAE
ncbi:N-formylglutamate amidohydrolase [Thermaurantiacus tibetensis]|uniref:N-formylglutamate amidohydrolase n=1 Tax=Thermaurantiacus tibetensis TaxID=2759035 RepID=UPI00188E3F31|nr:N-formylglutamate amidohydrolase [Thermaurantiacus tibetensis]